eukprot:scaffold7349_cov173-Amphora_coffeaeformis.AAC.16
MGLGLGEIVAKARLIRTPSRRKNEQRHDLKKTTRNENLTTTTTGKDCSREKKSVPINHQPHLSTNTKKARDASVAL